MARGGVARGTAEVDHRVFLMRLEFAAAEEFSVFVGLEVAHPHDDGPRLGHGGDLREAPGEAVDEVFGLVGEGAC